MRWTKYRERGGGGGIVTAYGESMERGERKRGGISN